MNVLVTGASGFIGGALCRELTHRHHTVRATVRTHSDASAAALAPVTDIVSLDLGALESMAGLARTLEGIDCVVHCGGLSQTPAGTPRQACELLEQVNVVGTTALADQAARAGVRRFVFVSSAKVSGERSRLGQALSPSAVPAPEDAYGISKLAAERGLEEIAKRSNLGLTIVRPPVVYGPGGKGNIPRMLRWIRRGIPLPLASVEYRRSLVFVDNLVGLLVRTVEDPRAAGETFHVSDGEDVSTPQLLRLAGLALGRPARLLPVPVSALRVAARITGRGAEIGRLLDSLQLDISRTKLRLDWSPYVDVATGLSRTVERL